MTGIDRVEQEFSDGADFHAAAVAAVDLAIGGLGADDELGADLALLDQVLPASLVAAPRVTQVGNHRRGLADKLA